VTQSEAGHGAGPDVRIRPATEADLWACAAIWWRCDYGVDAGIPDDPSLVSPLDHELATGTVLVAESDGDPPIVGFGGIVVRSGVTMLADLFVDPRWHGRGVGGRLLAAVMGDRWPRHTFSSGHANALPLYVRAGMAPRWLALYLRGDPAATGLGEGGGVVVRAGADPQHLAALESAWGGPVRPEDHAHWAGRTGAIAMLIEGPDGGPVGYAYADTEGHPGPAWQVPSMAVAPELDARRSLAAVAAVLGELAGRGVRSVGLVAPGPHPATIPLVRAGWRLEDRDIYAASGPELMDPERRLPDPTFA
jgi:GNAT superfamily N-acetyltransferase